MRRVDCWFLTFLSKVAAKESGRAESDCLGQVSKFNNSAENTPFLANLITDLRLSNAIAFER